MEINKDEIWQIYNSLQTKLTHVQYTTKKVMRIQSLMIESSENNKNTMHELNALINKLYTFKKGLEGKLKNTVGSEKRYKSKLIGMLDELVISTQRTYEMAASSHDLMNTTANSLLMAILKAVHYQWRERIYMSVISRNNNISHESEFSCILGKWYHSEGIEKFRHYPAFEKLGKVHSQLHVAADEIAKENFKTANWDTVSKKLVHFETISQSVIAALDELDDQIVKNKFNV